MPLLLGEARDREDDRIVFELVNEMLKGSAIIDIGGVTFPVDDATEMIEHEAELAPTIQRWFDLPFLPTCSSLRPSRRGCSNSSP